MTKVGKQLRARLDPSTSSGRASLGMNGDVRSADRDIAAPHMPQPLLQRIPGFSIAVRIHQDALLSWRPAGLARTAAAHDPGSRGTRRADLASSLLSEKLRMFGAVGWLGISSGPSFGGLARAPFDFAQNERG